MKIEACWVCGGMPQRTTRILYNVEWARLECCTAGGSSPHEENNVNTWNGVQRALKLSKALRTLDIDADQFIAAADRMIDYIGRVKP
jgi:hypothetical protein